MTIMKNTPQKKSSKPLSRRKPLKQKSSTKSSTPKKSTSPKRKSRVPLEQKTKPELVREAWTQFSRYVRLRDTVRDGNEWVGTCITCSKTGTVAWLDDSGKLRYTKGWDAGHFVGRSHKVVKHDEENVNLQCAFRCNKMRSGEYEKYRIALKDKYGEEVPEKLENLARTTTYYKFSREELLEVIHDSKELVAFLIK